MNVQYQHIADGAGNTAGVYVPIEQWHTLVSQLDVVKQPLSFDPPWCHQAIVQERLADYEKYPEQALDFDTTIQAIIQDSWCIELSCCRSPKETFREAKIWYDEQREGLGKTFVDQIIKKATFLKQYPKASSVRYANTRVALLDTFSFAIHYTVQERDKCVVIAAVLHNSRNPLIGLARSKS